MIWIKYFLSFVKYISCFQGTERPDTLIKIVCFFEFHPSLAHTVVLNTSCTGQSATWNRVLMLTCKQETKKNNYYLEIRQELYLFFKFTYVSWSLSWCDLIIKCKRRDLYFVELHQLQSFRVAFTCETLFLRIDIWRFSLTSVEICNQSLLDTSRGRTRREANSL